MESKNKIVAIVGMCGSGKSIATDFLVDKGWNKVYFGGVTMDVMKDEGLEVTPENEKYIRERLREEHGMGVYAKLSLPKIRELSLIGDTVLDGLYSWDELVILKQEFEDRLSLIAIVVDREIRYERLKIRKIRPLTREEAIKRDLAEIENIAKGGPIAMADYYIYNNGGMPSYIKALNETMNNINKIKIKVNKKIK